MKVKTDNGQFARSLRCGRFLWSSFARANSGPRQRLRCDYAVPRLDLGQTDHYRTICQKGVITLLPIELWPHLSYGAPLATNLQLDLQRWLRRIVVVFPTNPQKNGVSWKKEDKVVSTSNYSGQFNQSGSKDLDFATLLGIIAAFGLMLTAIAMGSGLRMFLNLESFMIVAGGTLGATLINFPLEDFRRSIAVLRTAFFPSNSSSLIRLHQIIDMARRSKASGNLVIQRDIINEEDSFLRKGVELVVDGIPASTIRSILSIELASLEDRHRRGAQLFQSMGAVTPAMGLIGTLIGLVQMLQHLHDPSQIGPAMATALLTTFYGAVLAYVVFVPLAGKLRARSREEALFKEMTIEGLACIAEGLNPRIIEQHLLSFLPPERRVSQYD